MTSSITIPGFSLRVFVSYSHKDRTIVERLVQNLKSEGIDVWIDQFELIAGESIRRSIEDAIASIDIFLIILSPNSSTSTWVQEELDLMFDRSTHQGAVLIPVVVSQCNIPGILRGRKWVDLASDYDQGLIELLNSLRSWAKRKKDKLLEDMLRDVEDSYGKSSRKASIAYAAVGKLAITVGRYSEALAILQKSIDRWPRNWDAYQLCAVTLIKLKRFEEAENILNQMLARNVQNSRTHFNLACLSSRKAESLGRSQKELHDKLLLECFEHLSRAFSNRFVFWLKQYASRLNPIADIMSDSDLFYARRMNPKVDELLISISKSHKHKWEGRQVYGGGGGGGGCLDGSTRVAMADGTQIPINQIKCGDLLLSESASGNSTVSQVWRKMRLWEDSGVTINNRLTATSTQPLYCSEGWKRADSLKTGDTLIGFGGKEIQISTIVSWDIPTVVYHVNLRGTPVFIAEDILVHNAKRH